MHVVCFTTLPILFEILSKMCWAVRGPPKHHCMYSPCKNIFIHKIDTEIHSFLKQCFSVYENKVLQLMSAGARLEKFGEKDLVFIKCRHCSQHEWTLCISIQNLHMFIKVVWFFLWILQVQTKTFIDGFGTNVAKFRLSTNIPNR